MQKLCKVQGLFTQSIEEHQILTKFQRTVCAVADENELLCFRKIGYEPVKSNVTDTKICP